MSCLPQEECPSELTLSSFLKITLVNLVMKMASESIPFPAIPLSIKLTEQL